jgi:hypothetical protein
VAIILGSRFEETGAGGGFFLLPFFDDADGFVEIVDVFEIHLHEVDVFFEDGADGVAGQGDGVGGGGDGGGGGLLGCLDEGREKEVLVEVEDCFDVTEDDSEFVGRWEWGDDVVNVNLIISWGVRRGRYVDEFLETTDISFLGFDNFFDNVGSFNSRLPHHLFDDVNGLFSLLLQINFFQFNPQSLGEIINLHRLLHFRFRRGIIIRKTNMSIRQLPKISKTR